MPRQDLIIYALIGFVIAVVANQMYVYLALILGFALAVTRQDIIKATVFTFIVGLVYGYYSGPMMIPNYISWFLPILNTLALPTIFIFGFCFAFAGLVGYVAGLIF